KTAKPWLIWIAVLYLLACRPCAGAQSPGTKEGNPPPLSIGDPAPPIQIGKWLKGDPILEFKKGNVYVIDIWATWCIPCLAAMPHTTELQRKYRGKGLLVIGVTSIDSFGNTEEAIRKLVERKGGAIGFAVGIDEASKSIRGYQG